MIVFALRHADRKPDPEDDLTPAGIDRAKLLARMLAESGIQKAYCSDAVRTQLTIQPLKTLLGSNLDVVIVDTKGPGGIEGHVKHIVDEVSALPGNAVAAVVGHSNTTRSIIQVLTGQSIDPIADHEFDKLFVLSIPATGASTIALTRYGQAT
jgi:phosphohistidine phosphatase SixA